MSVEVALENPTPSSETPAAGMARAGAFSSIREELELDTKIVAASASTIRVTTTERLSQCVRPAMSRSSLERLDARQTVHDGAENTTAPCDRTPPRLLRTQ